MNDSQTYMVKKRLEALERELLSVASHLDTTLDGVLRELTLSDIEERYEYARVQAARLRLTIRHLTETIEAL